MFVPDAPLVPAVGFVLDILGVSDIDGPPPEASGLLVSGALGVSDMTGPPPEPSGLLVSGALGVLDTTGPPPDASGSSSGSTPPGQQSDPGPEPPNMVAVVTPGVI